MQQNNHPIQKPPEQKTFKGIQHGLSNNMNKAEASSEDRDIPSPDARNTPLTVTQKHPIHNHGCNSRQDKPFKHQLNPIHKNPLVLLGCRWGMSLDP
jgi:hypothetical protein